VDILDARILNIELHFSVVADTLANKHDALRECVIGLQSEFVNHFDVGEPLFLGRVYSALKKINSVADVIDVSVVQKNGGRYSDLRFDLSSHTSPDNRYVSVPENVIFEIKFPGEDIKGTIR